MTKVLWEKFCNLACRLSPENLTCDGELSIEDQRKRYMDILKEWKKLEKKVGRSVTEAEVWKHIISDKFA